MVYMSKQVSFVYSSIGRNSYSPSDRSSVPDAAILLDSNENSSIPLGVDAPPHLVSDLRQLSEIAWNRYPTNDCKHLVECILDYREADKINKSNIILGNGSNEVILYTLLSLREKVNRAAIVSPSYSMYPHMLTTAGIPFIEFYSGWEDCTDPKKLLKWLNDNKIDLLLLCNPNNPTGHFIPTDHVLGLIKDFAGFFILDEAYLEYSNTPTSSLASYATTQDQLIVVKTFSKAWGLAGLRLGYGVASEPLINMIAPFTLPYRIPSATQALAASIIPHLDIQSDVENVRLERRRIIEVLSVLGFVTIPTQTNFITFYHQHLNSFVIADRLREKGVLIRAFASSEWLRVSVGSNSENDEFLRLIQDVVISGSSYLR